MPSSYNTYLLMFVYELSYAYIAVIGVPKVSWERKIESRIASSLLLVMMTKDSSS